MAACSFPPTMGMDGNLAIGRHKCDYYAGRHQPRLRLILFIVLPFLATTSISMPTMVSMVQSYGGSGTFMSTSLVKDILLAEPVASTQLNHQRPYISSADDGSNGRELWRTDGSNLGTIMVADVNPGAGNSSPSLLTHVGGYDLSKPSALTLAWKASPAMVIRVTPSDIVLEPHLQLNTQLDRIQRPTIRRWAERWRSGQ